MAEGRRKYYLPAIAWAVLIMIVSSIPNLSTPKLGITMTDKIAHFIEYFILGWFTARAIRAFIERPISIFLISSCLAALFGVLDELHQLFIPGRVTDVFDLAADVLGGILASAIYVRHFQKSLESRA